MRIFLFSTASRPAQGPTQPPIQWVSGVKWPEREDDHSPPSTAEVKNVWCYTSIPQYVVMAWCLVKHRDNFTFTLPSIIIIIIIIIIITTTTTTTTTTTIIVIPYNNISVSRCSTFGAGKAANDLIQETCTL
jgi:hypothetical protein